MAKKQLNKNEELLLDILFDVYLQTICQINCRLFLADLEQIHRFIKLHEMKNNKNLFEAFIKENNYLVLFEKEYSKYQKLVKSEIECEFYFNIFFSKSIAIMGSIIDNYLASNK